MKVIKTHHDYVNLVKEVLEHDRLYYEKCKPVISDYEYDLLVKELERYEKEHPDKIVSYSPTQRIGEKPTKGFKQGKHTVPMLSLANTYSEEEVEDYVNRVKKLLEKKEVLFCCELKMDGTAVSVRYEDGRYVRALTRGNGIIGDDVTANVKTIRSLPLILSGKDIPKDLEIRGEVFMHKHTFQQINQHRQEEGLEPWANPRNAAAGSLKLLDPRQVAKRRLNVFFYGIDDTEVKSQFEVHQYLKRLGLPIAKENLFAKCSTIKEIFKFADKIDKLRDSLAFEIDGIVIKVDAIATHKKLGTTGKSPRFAVAYKFSPKQAFTQIENISVQVGKTGVLTPVAELKPVQLAGSTISRASLYNEDEIKRKDIRIKDWVVIEKGGDVIPKVVEVDLKKRPKHTHGWKMPEKCPVCSHATERKKGEVAVRCTNPKCGGQRLRKLIFFASKQAMDIEHLGPKIVEQLVSAGLISRVSDLYTLDGKALAQLEGFKEKSIQNLLESIEYSKHCTLDQFIMGLEIKYVGKETAQLLAEEAGDIEHLIKMKKEELLDLEGIGEKVAESIVDYFADSSNLEEIHLLLKRGVHPQKMAKRKAVGHPFSKKIFVLTGTLENYTRQEASRLIKERGGKTSGSVSKKTDFVLLGENPGSKYEKAKKLNIKIITEKEFEKML